MSYMIQPHCRCCGTTVSYFGDLCEWCDDRGFDSDPLPFPDDIGDGLLLIVSNDIHALSERHEL